MRHGRAVGGKRTDSRFLVLSHEAAVAFYIGTEDSGESTFKTLFCHNSTPSFKVSNRGTHDVDVLESVKFRSERGFDFENG
jgi:hypothetical protein